MTQIHQIQNVVHLWKWKDLSAVSRKFFWSVEIEQPLLVAKLTRAEINGLAACRCVGAAEPPWNSLHSIWCPSPLPALHMFLLKDLVILDPNPSNSKRTAPMKMERLVGGLTQVFLKRRDWTASVGCKADTGWDKWPCSLSLCGGRRSSMKLSSFHIMSISTSCSSHVSFEILSCHTWPKFIKFKT